MSIQECKRDKGSDLQHGSWPTYTSYFPDLVFFLMVTAVFLDPGGRKRNSEVDGSIHVKWMPALAAETCLAAFLASPPLPSPLVLGSINCDRCSPGKVSGRQGSSIFRAHALSRCGPVAQECWRGRGVSASPAVRATLRGFPLATRASYFRLRSGLYRIATTAGM